jgi:ammonia channel protein AmtB
VFPVGEGVIDFAGGITIHTAAGVASLVSALGMQPRAIGLTGSAGPACGL